MPCTVLFTQNYNFRFLIRHTSFSPSAVIPWHLIKYSARKWRQKRPNFYTSPLPDAAPALQHPDSVALRQINSFHPAHVKLCPILSILLSCSFVPMCTVQLRKCCPPSPINKISLLAAHEDSILIVYFYAPPRFITLGISPAVIPMTSFQATTDTNRCRNRNRNSQHGQAAYQPRCISFNFEFRTRANSIWREELIGKSAFKPRVPFPWIFISMSNFWI